MRFFSIEKSSEKALDAGFVQYTSTDSREFAPAFRHPITKLKWVHSVRHLAQSLQTESYIDLLDEGYDVASYYLHNLSDEEVGTLPHVNWFAAHECAMHCLPFILSKKDVINSPSQLKECAEIVVQDIYSLSHFLYDEIIFITYSKARICIKI